MRRRYSIWLALIVLVAGGLRFYRLAAQSLWADEGNSVALATRSLIQIARDAASDIHPPLYYLLLHLWVSLFGTSEIAIRSLSVFFSLLMVPLVALLARRLWGERAGLASAAFIAMSPFQVYYAQEARMYALLALLSVGTAYGVAGIFQPDGTDRSQKRAIAFYLLCGTLGLYTHYSFAFLLLAFNLAYAIHTIWTRTQGALFKRLALWAMLQIAMLILYLPWLPTAIARGRAWPTVGAVPTLTDAMTQAGSWLYLGSASIAVLPVWLRWLPVILAIIAIAFHKRETGNTIRVWLALWLIFPAALLLASGAFRTANLKILLISNPALCLLLGYGLSGALPQVRQLRFVWIPLSLLAVSIPTASALVGHYTDPRLAKDDYRGMAHYIAAVADSRDAILLNAPGQIEVFRYYDESGLAIYPLPRQRPPDPAATEVELASIEVQHRRLFTLFWATDESDPNRIVETWLDRHAFKALDLWQGNVRFVLYALPAQEELVPQGIHAEYGQTPKITLKEVSLQDGPVKAGEVLQVSLQWEAMVSLAERYKVSVQLLDSASQVIAQRDAEPVGNSHPTTEWLVGEQVSDLHGLYILPGTPPGTYRLQVIVYDAESGVRLPMSTGGDAFEVRVIEVERPATPPPVAALRMMTPRQIDWTEIRLLGFDLYRRGFSHTPETPLHAGDLLHVSLYWQALAKPTATWRVQLELLDGRGNVVVAREAPPASDSYPTTVWEEGEIVRGDADLVLPPEMEPGRYRLRLALLDSGESPIHPVVVASVSIVP